MADETIYTYKGQPIAELSEAEVHEAFGIVCTEALYWRNACVEWGERYRQLKEGKVAASGVSYKDRG